MGWIAYHKNGEVFREETHGRPMKEGKKGDLVLIDQQDYLHSVAVDLVSGTIFIDHEGIEFEKQDRMYMTIKNPKSIIRICYDTTIVGELFHLDKTVPDKEGWFTQTQRPLIWRPIWFSRYVMAPVGTVVVKVIGAQTTLPKEFGGHNVKKLISLFPDGSIGVA